MKKTQKKTLIKIKTQKLIKKRSMKCKNNQKSKKP